MFTLTVWEPTALPKELVIVTTPETATFGTIVIVELETTVKGNEVDPIFTAVIPENPEPFIVIVLLIQLFKDETLLIEGKLPELNKSVVAKNG